MKKRDLEIVNDLERFRVMSRNDIADLYFSHLKNPITNTNTVLKRMVRDKQIDVGQSFRPFVYFPINSTIKRNSTKIPHFLKIVNVYRQLRKYYTPKEFYVEPKFKKGLAEPDILTVINGTSFFIEIQRSVYSQRVMDEKMKKYGALYQSDEFETFPFIIMISDTKYEINVDEINVFQVQTINDFMRNLGKKQQVKSYEKEIKIQVG